MPLKFADFVKESWRGGKRHKANTKGSPAARAHPDGNASLGRAQRPALSRRAWGIARQFFGLHEPRDELWRTRSPRRLLRISQRIAARMLARLFGNDFRHMRLALRTEVSIRAGWSAYAARVARKFLATAPSTARRAVASDLLKAVEAGDLERAARIARHTRQSIGRQETRKIISRKYRFFWLGNLKVASRSIIVALRAADPEAEEFNAASVDDILPLRPEVRDYFCFAFVRDPFSRFLSLYTNKFLQKKVDWKSWQSRYYGLSSEMDFESFCAWLASPYGADEFADPHWRSQHLNIAMPGRMLDFVGRLETIGEDFRTVARRIGLPDLHLPFRNTVAGRMPENGKEVAAMRRAAESAHLTDRAQELLRKRYADDFRIFGYDPGQSTIPCRT